VSRQFRPEKINNFDKINSSLDLTYVICLRGGVAPQPLVIIRAPAKNVWLHHYVNQYHISIVTTSEYKLQYNIKPTRVNFTHYSAWPVHQKHARGGKVHGMYAEDAPMTSAA